MLMKQSCYKYSFEEDIGTLWFEFAEKSVRAFIASWYVMNLFVF